jgi:hypothetical protein
MSQIVTPLDPASPEGRALAARWTRTLAVIEREIEEREHRAGSTGGAGSGPGGPAGPRPAEPPRPTTDPAPGRAAA